MSEQENMNLAQQVYENFKSGDIKALLNLLSDNVEWQLPEISQHKVANLSGCLARRRQARASH